MGAQLLRKRGPLDGAGRSVASEPNIAAGLGESQPRPRWLSLASQQREDERADLVAQAEQQPRVVLLEGEVGIEFGEKGSVRQVVVACDPGLFEGSAGQVREVVVFAGNGERG